MSEEVDFQSHYTKKCGLSNWNFPYIENVASLLVTLKQTKKIFSIFCVPRLYEIHILIIWNKIIAKRICKQTEKKNLHTARRCSCNTIYYSSYNFIKCFTWSSPNFLNMNNNIDVPTSIIIFNRFGYMEKPFHD